jgi:hypothetical protein
VTEHRDPPAPVRSLVGVYHANGTILGELSYWVKARLGRGHCALCDITHGSVREKASWRDCRDALAVPMTTVHLDERTPDVAAATDGRTPCIAAVTDAGVEILLTTGELDRCGGDPARLAAAIDDALAKRDRR